MTHQDAPRFIDLFAGLGGFHIGMERNGFKAVWGSEINKHAAEVYNLNFHKDIHNDITKVDIDSIPKFDIICGGFPCQAFSKAGRQAGFEDTRGTLFFNIAKIAKEREPEVLFLENVKNLVLHDKGNTFKVIKATLEQLGYNVVTKLLNAADFGVPQNRERIIIVANKKGKEFDFSKVQTITPRPVIKDVLDSTLYGTDESAFDWLDQKDYVLLPSQQVHTNQPSGLRFIGYRKAILRTGMEGQEHMNRAHRQPNRIYSEEGTHPTLSSQETAGRYLIAVKKKDNSIGVRKLTMSECYRMFGFPEDYQLIGAKTHQYARIGNSICVPMVQAVAKEIQAQLF